jgi:hypothetical protein
MPLHRISGLVIHSYYQKQASEFIHYKTVCITTQHNSHTYTYYFTLPITSSSGIILTVPYTNTLIDVLVTYHIITLYLCLAGTHMFQTILYAAATNTCIVSTFLTLP